MPHAKRWILSARAVQNPPLIHAIYFIFSFNRQTTPLRRDRGQTPRPRLGTRGLTPVPKALVVLVLALSVVGICSVLSEVMLVKKVLWHSLYSRIECHGVVCHLCDSLENHRIIYGSLGSLAPCEWAMVLYHDSRNGKGVRVADCLYNDISCVKLISLIDFLRGQVPCAWNIAVEIVCVCCSECRNIHSRLRECDCPLRMCMYNTANLRVLLIEHKMCSRVR